MNKPNKGTVTKVVAASNPCFGCSGCSTGDPKTSPKITIIPGISPSHDHGVEYDRADLLILAKVSDSDLGPGPMAFDVHHAGAISKSIAENGFRGEVGELLQIDVQSADPMGKCRHIAVVGLGKAEDVTRRGMCTLFNHALALAHRLNAKTMLIPIFPQRTSAGALNLRATGAILRCLVNERLRRGTLGNLQDVQILCVPQARRHLETGLAVEHTLCSVCRIPNLF